MNLRVYEFKDWTPERWSLSGDGSVQALAFSGEDVRLRLDGTQPGDELRLHVGSYWRWRATLDGQPVDLRETPAHGDERPLILALDAQDGLLQLHYHRGWQDLLAALASVAALLGVLGLLGLDGWQRLRARPS